MEKISATFISDLFINSFWFIVFSVREICLDIKKILISVFCILTAVCIAVSVWASFFRTAEPSIRYNFVIPEKNAVSVNNDIEKSIYLADGEKVEIILDDSVYVDTVYANVNLLFGLPKDFSYDATVSIRSTGYEIARSGRITAGQKINVLNLLIGFDDMYAVMEESAELIVDFYDSKTGQLLEKRVCIGVALSSNAGDFI